jgi:5-formyltetrahydrofolate cyclo-ligase
MRAQLAALDPQGRAARSQAIADKLFQLPAVRQASVVLFYYSFNGEVETPPMMRRAQQAGQQIALPWMQPEARRLVPCLVEDLEQDVEVGPYGIRQPGPSRRRPIALQAIGAIVVPGLAFDGAGHRLGRGLGYYDRLLQEVPPTAARIGVAFDFQLVPALPTAAHDATMTAVVTG